MKSKNILWGIFFLVFACSTVPVQAQELSIKKAEEAFNSGDYYGALQIYKDLARAYDDIRILRGMGSAFLKIQDFDSAEEWYRKVVDKPEANEVDFLAFGRILNHNEKFDEALEVVETFKKNRGETENLSSIISNARIGSQMAKGVDMYTVKEVKFNSKESDMIPLYFKDGLIFSSNRERGFFSRFHDASNGQPYFDLYFASLADPKGGAKLMKDGLNSKLHDAGASMSSDGTTLFYSQSYPTTVKNLSNTRFHNNLCILKTTNDGKGWSNPTEVKFNDPNFSCSHPSISSDGNMLFFASDMPGGMGGTDLYSAFWDGEAWGEYQNLGPNVNTPGNEMFPFIYNNDMLFFSSEGHPGNGGMDIYYSNLVEGEWGSAHNVGAPINSPADDFSIVVNTSGAAGYFSSNREGGTGGDDIYDFKRKTHIKGTITDELTDKPVANAEVMILYPNNKTTKLETDDNGMYETYVKTDADFLLKAKKETYAESKMEATTRGWDPLEDLILDMSLERSNMFSVQGKVLDAATGKLIRNPEVRLVLEGKGVSLETDEKGNYQLDLGYQPRDYTLFFLKEGYVPQKQTFSTKGFTEPKIFTVDGSLEKGDGYLLEATVIATDSKLPINHANAVIMDKAFEKEYFQTITDVDGKFVAIVKDLGFVVTSVSHKYFSEFSSLPKPSQAVADKQLVVEMVIEMVPHEVGQIVRRIHFEYDKAHISEEFGKDLYSLVYFMRINPDAKAELSAHTDARGSSEYNFELSQRRAEAVKEFLIERGISADRIIAKGYGKTVPVHKCDDTPCTETEHFENRRCEMKIIGLGGMQ